MSIVLLGSTSGSCTLQEQAVAGSSVITLPVGTGTAVVNGVNGSLVSGTAVASTSGTSIDFTSIPSWVKRITVIFRGVSTNGTSNLLIQIGDGSVNTTGYVSSTTGTSGSGGSTFSSTAGFVSYNTDASYLISGSIVLMSIGSNAWVSNGSGKLNTGACFVCGGDKALSTALDRVRITTANGTDAFDAGTINILYE
jgi:hypothetical protein